MGAVTDVWGSPEASGPDPCRIDKMEDALRSKLETISGFDERPLFALKKVFNEADADGSGKISENEFVAIMANKLNFAGYEADVQALFRRYDRDKSRYITLKEFGAALLGYPGTQATTTIGKVREILARRSGGASTLRSMGVQFKLMDRSGDGLVDPEELKVGFDRFMRGFGVVLTKQQIEQLIITFDANNDGQISYDEFVRGLRGGMGEERLTFVKMAFDILDADKSGELSLGEIKSRYDVSQHPKVVSGEMTEEEAIHLFIGQWDKSGDDIVTYEEFVEYYEWVSSSIDDDSYFELMMRNAWHISGGKGWCENTSNLRVLVTRADGTQTVEEVKDDLGLKKTDIEGIKQRLMSQGITDITAISTAD